MAKVNPIQLQKALKGVKYPADKKALLTAAKGNKCDDNIRSTIEKLPEQEYGRPSDVSKAVREME
jgi:hypothetical protein